MKPADLKIPLNWKERPILIHDQVWYVPELAQDFASFTFPGWSHPSLFVADQPIQIEYCSGNGAWIAAKALAQPLVNWVAIECQFERVRKIWSKMKNFNLANLLPVCGEAFCVTQKYIPKHSVDAVYINFPDPWPKRRHAKNRLIQIPFLDEIRRILKPNGTFTFVTDDEAYSHYTIKVLQKTIGFKPLFEMPYYRFEYPDYGTSYFEDLWRQKGKAIRYHAYIKLDEKFMEDEIVKDEILLSLSCG